MNNKLNNKMNKKNKLNKKSVRLHKKYINKKRILQ